MFGLDELYKQAFALYAWYRVGKLTKEQYLTYLKPIDKAISELEMGMLKHDPVLKKASLPYFGKPKH